MALYEIKERELAKLKDASFSDHDILERQDLQRLIRQQIEVIAPDTMVIEEEFGDWEDSRRRIDLLCLDKEANLVVIELKRTDTGGHMELQALRYAAMISTMTFQQVVEAHARYLKRNGAEDGAAEELILNFLEWVEPNEDEFGKDVRIVLASAAFSKEITTAVIWLNQQGLDIRCVRLSPYELEHHLVVDIDQIIPLPEAQEYQVRVRQKSEQQRVARASGSSRTTFDLNIDGRTLDHLPKRLLIYKVVQDAIRRGVTPERIGELIDSNKRAWFSVDGERNQEGFVAEANKSRGEAGRTFNPGRYFVSDSELFHVNGRTYAFSNQWGPSTERTVDLIIDALKPAGISYRASDT